MQLVETVHGGKALFPQLSVNDREPGPVADRASPVHAIQILRLNPEITRHQEKSVEIQIWAVTT